MPYIPEAVKVTPTIEVHDAKLQEPMFYDPQEDRLETYREFHNRPCIRTNLGKAFTTCVVMFIFVTVILLIISGFEEEDKKNKNKHFNVTDALYDDFLIIMY
tara:strand:+ start:2341 stop:2646 length:306 start_codon:yes stop_codon:yes gene_type:complete